MKNPSFWIILISYSVLLGFISLYLSRRVKNSDDFFLARGQTTWWTSGMSFFMTAFSASVFVANASLAYNYGALNILLIVAQMPVFFVGYFYMAKRWHRSGCDTAIGFLDQRFGKGTSQFFAWSGIPIRILDNANRVYVTAVLMEALFGFPLTLAVTVTCALTLLYSIGGGFLAVIVTDTLQGIILTVIVAAVALLACSKVGSLSNFMEGLPADYWTLSSSDGTFTVPLICSWVFIAIFAWNGNWSLVQRYVAVGTEKDARRVSLMAGASYYLLFPLLALPPMLAAVLLPELKGTTGAEQSYVKLAEMVLPAGMLGLLCFAILGATVTALNSELNVMSQVLVQDVFKKKLAGRSKKLSLLVGRLLVVLLLVCCLLISLKIREFGGAFKYLMTVLGMTTLPTFIPLILGLYMKRPDGRACMGAFTVGMIVSILGKFAFDLPLWAIIASNGVATTLVFCLAPSFLKTNLEQMVKQNEFFKKFEQPRPAYPDQNDQSASNGHTLVEQIMTLSLAGLGALLLATSLIFERSSLSVTIPTAAIFFVVAYCFHLLKRKKDQNEASKVAANITSK